MKPPPVSTRLSLLSPEVSLAVEPARMRALLEGAYAPQLAKLVKPRDRMATARALWGRKVPLLVAQRLEALAWLATPAGREALLEGARDLKWDHAGWESEGPADLAARLLAEALESFQVLLRAELRLYRVPIERPTYELRAWKPRRVPEGRTAALVAALRGVAGAQDAWVHEDDETGDLHAVALYGERADAFRFRVAEGRLAVTSFRPQRLDAYGEAWGRALYGAERFFAHDASVTLRPLQELGSAGLRAATERGKLLPDVPRVRVVSCQIEKGGGHRVEAQGPDALACIAPHMREGGRLLRATVRVDVSGELRPVDCVVQPPNRLDVDWGGVARSGARGPRIAREALSRLGLLSPPDVFADDITTLRPLVQAGWRWHLLADKDGFEAMEQAGLFRPVHARESRRADHPDYDRFGSVVAYPLYRPPTPPPGGHPPVDPDAPEHEKRRIAAIRATEEIMPGLTKYYLVPDDPALQATTVRQMDMWMQRLSLGALVRKVRREMGLERGDKPRGLPKGVLWIGEMRVEGGVVRFFYVVRAATDDKDRAAIGRAIVKAAGFARVVVMVPAGRKLGRDFVELELDVKQQIGAASWRGKVAEAVRALGLEDKVAPERIAPEDARLVVDTRTERAVLDGVPLKLGESGLKLLRVMAEQQAKGIHEVPTKVTDKAISGARASDGATRNVVWKLGGWVKRSFAEAGRDVPADVAGAGLVKWSRPRGWVLAVKAVVT